MSQKYEYFGKYILLEKLATGGMAEVWLARAPGAGGIGKFVAIKKILPQFSDNPEFIQMFKDEAAIAMNLSHSNIVSIYEFGQEKNQLFLVMDYVEGRNLRQILNKMKSSEFKFTTDQVIYAMKEVAAGLDHAHRSLNSATGKPLNITHRDMSPQNIMITFEGEVKIVDFGIAKAESQIENTKTGTLKGKFGYMSPEQAEGHATDLRTDIFSLGICLWELLASDRLFIANNEINTLKKIRECNIPSLTKVNPNIPVELERITMKALTRDRNLRYQTAAAMHRDLNRFLNRQYPDFTPHDFSVFIKTLYTDEILDLRKRLIEYAKIPFKPTTVRGDEGDKTLVTSFPQMPDNKTRSKSIEITQSNEISSKTNATITETESFSAISNPSLSNDDVTKTPMSQSLSISKSELAPKSPVLDDKLMKQSLAQKIVIEPKAPPQISDVSSPDQFSLSSSFPQSAQQNRRNNLGHFKKMAAKDSNSSINLMIFVAFMIITYVVASTFFSKELSRASQTLFSMLKGAPISPHKVSPGGANDKINPSLIIEPDLVVEKPVRTIAPGEKVGLVVNSIPSGAEIFINGINTGKTTPSRVEVPAATKFTIGLKLARFLDYTKSNLSSDVTGRSFTATLQKAMVAYVDIDVKPPMNSVNITVNGQLLKDEILPISKYAIPAGTPILIRAENPVTGAAAEQVVTLREDQRYRVILKLDKGRRSPSGRRSN